MPSIDAPPSSAHPMALGAILFLGLGIWVAGHLSDTFGSGVVLKWGCYATMLIGLLFGPFLGSGSLLLVWIGLSSALFIMGLVYGPLGAWLPDQFPVRVRYTGASVAFNAGGILGVALAPVVAQWLGETRGTDAVGYYLAAAGLLSVIGLNCHSVTLIPDSPECPLS